MVVATGFESGRGGQLLDVPDVVGDDGRPRFKRSGRATPHPGLYFIGFDETTRGVLCRRARHDSLRLAKEVRRYLDAGALRRLDPERPALEQHERDRGGDDEQRDRDADPRGGQILVPWTSAVRMTALSPATTGSDDHVAQVRAPEALAPPGGR